MSLIRKYHRNIEDNKAQRDTFQTTELVTPTRICRLPEVFPRLYTYPQDSLMLQSINMDGWNLL